MPKHYTWSHQATPGHNLATSGNTWQHLVTSNCQHPDPNCNLYSGAAYEIWISRPFFSWTLTDRAGSGDKRSWHWPWPPPKILSRSDHAPRNSSPRNRQTDYKTSMKLEFPASFSVEPWPNGPVLEIKVSDHNPNHHRKFHGDPIRHLGLVRPATNRQKTNGSEPLSLCTMNGDFWYLSPHATRGDW